MKRQRGRGGRKGNGHQPNRNFESNGPGIKIRGSANHIYEKYLQLARDELSSGDRVMAESYLQHAEHYYRVLATMNKGVPPPRSEHDPREIDLAGFDDDDDDDGAEGDEAGEADRPNGADIQPREQRPHDARGQHGREDGGGRQDQRRDDQRREPRRDSRPDFRGETRGEFRPEGRGEPRHDSRADGRQDGRDGRSDFRREPRAQLAPITPLSPPAPQIAAAPPAPEIDPLPLQVQTGAEDVDRLPAFLSAGPTTIGEEPAADAPVARRRRRRRTAGAPGLFQGEGDAEAEAALEGAAESETPSPAPPPVVPVAETVDPADAP